MTDNVRDVLGRMADLKARVRAYDEGSRAAGDIQFAAGIAADLAEVALALLDENVTLPMRIDSVTDAGDDWAIECDAGGLFVSKARCEEPPVAGDTVHVWRNRLGRIYGVRVNDRLVTYREDLM